MAEFEVALLRSVKQVMDGQYARVHKSDEIVSRRGRPVGSMEAVRKSATIIRLDEEILIACKATGQGWQTRMKMHCGIILIRKRCAGTGLGAAFFQSRCCWRRPAG